MTAMTRWRGGRWCGMAEFAAIPADLRGKGKPIPAGYPHENKGSAGIAGIRTNTNMRGEKYVMSHMRVRTWEIQSIGGYPRYPRRVIVFMHLTCGDSLRHSRRQPSGTANGRQAPMAVKLIHLPTVVVVASVVMVSVGMAVAAVEHMVCAEPHPPGRGGGPAERVRMVRTRHGVWHGNAGAAPQTSPSAVFGRRVDLVPGHARRRSHGYPVATVGTFPARIPGTETRFRAAAGMVPQSRYLEGNLQVNDPKLNTLTTIWRH
jgi:hypothetical protein